MAKLNVAKDLYLRKKNDMDVTIENIQKILKSDVRGQIPITIDKLKELYKLEERPKAKAVKLFNAYYVTLSTNENVQFKISSNIKDEELSFIEELKTIKATDNYQNFYKFLFIEFFQGDRFYKRIFRFFNTTFPVLTFVFLCYRFATLESISNILNGLLTSVSVFVAIFSVFTVSHDYMEKKNIQLFEDGKLAYYFSVDRNITIAGILSILFLIYAIIVVPSGLYSDNEQVVMFYSVPKDIRFILLSIFSITAFLFLYISLRSLVEFYIIRPSRFILGEIKDESLKSINN